MPPILLKADLLVMLLFLGEAAVSIVEIPDEVAEKCFRLPIVSRRFPRLASFPQFAEAPMLQKTWDYIVSPIGQERNGEEVLALVVYAVVT